MDSLATTQCAKLSSLRAKRGSPSPRGSKMDGRAALAMTGMGSLAMTGMRSLSMSGGVLP
jgi:hypothetical protein